MTPQARRAFRRMQSPGAPKEVDAPKQTFGTSGKIVVSDDRRREQQYMRPNFAPSYSGAVDLRNEIQLVAVGATVVLLTHTMPPGREGVVKSYGLGFMDTSLLPASNVGITFFLLVDGNRVTPDEGQPGYFTLISSTKEDAKLIKLTRSIRGGETLSIVVTNGTGIALDLWGRVRGWWFDAQPLEKGAMM